MKEDLRWAEEEKHTGSCETISVRTPGLSVRVAHQTLSREPRRKQRYVQKKALGSEVSELLEGE